MKIPAKIDFKELNEVKYFREGSAEYTALKKVNDDGIWKDYCNELLSRGISSRYDVTSDMFIIKPVAFNTLKESVDLEDIDIEDNEDALSSIEDEDEINYDVEDENIENEIQDETNNKMQVVSLDDVMALFKEILPNINNGITDPLAETNEVSLTAKEEDLKNTYFQSTGNETLDSEFEGIDSNLNNFKDKSSTESYITSLGSTTNPVDHEGITDPMEILNQIGFSQENVDDIEVDSFSTDISAFDHMPYESESNYGMGNTCLPPNGYRYDQAAPGYLDGTMDYGGKNDHDMYEPSDELLLDDEFDEDDSYIHPDISRISGDLDYSEEDEYDEPILMLDEPEMDEPEVPKMNINKTVNMGGTPVQIVLTGVMITAPELNYIGESVKKAGNKLKSISGKDNKLQIVIESAGKQYTINYQDTHSYIEPLPFSIKRYKFKSLEESLNRINYSVDDRQQEVFKGIIKEDISAREINNYKSTDIFDINENIKYISSWNVANIGTIDLKKCLNEKYSDITLMGSEPNTLVKDSEGNFLLFKGNLKERSKVGVKKELVENAIRRNRNYGTCEVVGVYPNTPSGLGEVMYDTKKSVLPLLIWK